MEANLLGAQPSAIALDQRVHGNGYPQPAADATEQGAEKTERSSRLISGSIHRAGTLLLVCGVTVAQLVWVALLGYGLYWVGTRLPL
jgi:hypothetical protein